MSGPSTAPVVPELLLTAREAQSVPVVLPTAGVSTACTV